MKIFDYKNLFFTTQYTISINFIIKQLYIRQIVDLIH